MKQVNGKREGVGSSVPRLEDDRYLRGRGRYIADIRLPGMLDVAFVRSPLAHARIRGIAKPEGHESSVFVAADLDGVKGIRADSGLPGFRSSVQPVLAHEKVRHVGEPLAACLAETRADAEDIAEQVVLDLEELPAVVEMTRARDRNAPLVHEHWPENVFLETAVDINFEAAAKDAAVKVKRTFRTARQSMAPMEGRGVAAYWDNQAQQIVVYSSTQMPHIVRNGLAECLGLDQGMIRVVAPDVGGGFGYKGILLGEEVCLAYLAMRLKRPLRWIEDRRVREELNLTGTHLGCEHGVCGACTMIVDGRPIRSCLSYAVACAGSDVRTVEAFDDDPVMGLLRSAFTRHHALQCGYCTPGMLATAYDIVTRLPGADETRIREELSGNLCRCTGYVGIVAAIRDVLSSGPHRSTARVAAPAEALAATGWASQSAPNAAPAAGDAPIQSAMPLPEQIEGGVTLTRTVSVPVSVDRLWAALTDIETVARCLPGATIEAVNPDGSVVGAFQVAIGPMRARFRGTARIAFDAKAHSGEVRGAGGDGISRSRADGAIRFAARPEADNASRLDIDITYKLSGPLAQFGRPAVVESVVDRLLGDVASNLAQAALGGTVAVAAPIGGIGFLFGTLLGMMRKLFSSR